MQTPTPDRPDQDPVSRNAATPSRRRLRVPHTLVLLFGMIVLAWLATLILPQGEYRREAIDGHDRVVPGSYTEREESHRLSPLAVLTAVPQGFHAAQDIIFFVFIVGGIFGILRATGAPEAMIGTLLARLGHRPKLLLLGGMLVFAIGSSTIGMAEEYLPFVPILIALCLGLGFDRLTAVAVLCLGYAIGYGTAMINPFTVMIAQGVAEVEPASGWPYRMVLLFVFLAMGFHHVWRYASRVKAEPSRSYVADVPHPEDLQADPAARMTATHAVIVALVVATIGLIVWGIKEHGWYMTELGAIFLGLGIVLAFVGRLGADGAAREFCTGAAELTTTALLIGFARAIKIVLDDGMVTDTIIEAISNPLETLPAWASAIGMVVVQCCCNLFIPSGSGQAYVTMPIMAPLGDIVGVSRQTSVLAYQFGDGFTNIIVPTNPVLVGILGLAGVPFDRWLRFVVPFMIKTMILASIAIVVAVWIDYA